MSIWHVIVDIIMVGMAVLIVAMCTTNGFVKPILKLTKALIIILITGVIATNLVDFCRDAFVNDMFEGKISTPIVEKIEEGAGDINLEGIKEQLPQSIKTFLKINDVDIDKYLQSAEDKGMEIVKAIGIKVEMLLIDTVSNIISYLIAFIISLVICSVAIFILEKILSLPIVSTIDKTLGLVWGVVESYIVISAMAFALSMFMGMEFLEGTFVANFLYQIGVFSILHL